MNNKKISWILYINMIINTILLLDVLWVLFCFLHYPLPERTKIQYMTPDMIKEGQGIAIVSFEVCFYILVSLLPISWVLSSILTAKILPKFNYIYQPKSGWSYTFLYLYGFLNILLPLFFGHFMIIFWIKINKSDWKYSGFAKFKSYKTHWNILTIGTDAFIIMMPVAFVSYAYIHFSNLYNRIPNRKNDLMDAWTLSSNKPNTMILYFDRTMGLIFNELLAVDYLVFKNEGTSLAQLYPEFTSYFNMLSLSQVTDGSIPSIYGSFFTKPLNKSKDEYNPWIELMNINKKNKDLTYDEWLKLALLINTNMLEKYNYHNISFLDIPYYGDYDAWNNWYRNNNSTQLEKEIKSQIDSKTNIHFFDEREEAKALDFKPLIFDFDIRPFQQFASHNNTTTQQHNNTTTQQHNNGGNLNPYGTNQLMNNKINLSISDHKDQSFLMFHNLFTHEEYSFIRSNIDDCFDDNINNHNPSQGDVSWMGRNDNGLWTSIWYMIQKLKNIFDYLKQLPYNGEHSDIIKNQYDNTSVYVISDHGANFSSFEDVNKVNKFLIQNNLMTSEQSNYLDNLLKTKHFISHHNSTFAMKPRKYIHNKWNKTINSDPLKNIFDLQSFISNGDILTIIESELQKENMDFNNSLNIEFGYDYNNSFFINKKDEDLILDPLNNTHLLQNRILKISNVAPFNIHNHKDLGISKTYKFKPNKSIYDEDSWT